MIVARVLYLFAPLLVASLVSAVVLRFDLLQWAKRPIDGGRTFRGHRLFGDSKTWRGVLVAVVGAGIAAALQARFSIEALAVVDYQAMSPLAFGAAMGLGAMLGELPNSFTKRQLGIAPGKTTKGPRAALFYVWDQVDLLTGAWPLMLCFMRPSATVLAASFAVALVAHPTVSLIGWVIGARKTAR